MFLVLPREIEEVYKQIRAKIIDGVYEPSSPIAEVPLATEYGIKRTRIRQIIQKLENESLVERYPNRGAFVKPITSKGLKEIFELREALESMAARLAARRRKDEDLEEMVALFAKHEGTSTDNLAEKINMSEQLHEFVLKSCENSKICDALEPLKVHIMRAWKVGLIIPDRINTAFKEHLEILDAIKGRDEEMAERKMRKHISDAFREYIKVTILDESEGKRMVEDPMAHGGSEIKDLFQAK